MTVYVGNALGIAPDPRLVKEAFDDCWGHLRPKAGRYKGYIEVSLSAFGDMGIHDIEFDDVDGNPYTFEMACEFGLANCPDETGGVYRWTGEYVRKTLRSGEESHRFVNGKWSKVF